MNKSRDGLEFDWTKPDPKTIKDKEPKNSEEEDASKEAKKEA